VFSIPTSWKQLLKDTLRALLVISKNPAPQFAIKNPLEAASKYYFEAGSHIYAQKLALAAATRQIGWNARGLFSDEISEFYTLKRQLQFERFKIELRDDILATLNQGLKTSFRKLELDCEVSIKGLLTIAEVEKADAALDAGTIPFADIWNLFRRS
jgi:hypothetical protein